MTGVEAGTRAADLGTVELAQVGGERIWVWYSRNTGQKVFASAELLIRARSSLSVRQATVATAKEWAIDLWVVVWWVDV